MIGLGIFFFFFFFGGGGAISETTPFNEACHLEKYPLRPISFSISNFTSLMSMLLLFLAYSIYLSIYYLLCYIAGIFVSIFITKRPHTRLSAPHHEFNGHAVYLAKKKV